MHSVSCVYIMVLIMSALAPLHALLEVKFYAGFLCDLEKRILLKCSRLVPNVKPRNACVFGCNKDPECVGASVSDTQSCYYHKACTAASDCVEKENEHKYLSKNCAHGGVWNPGTSRCACANGWVGENCLDLASECPDLFHLGGYPEGDQLTHLNMTNQAVAAINPIFPVMCKVLNSGTYWEIKVFNNFGDGNFGDRTWDEYKNGFYADTSNYWIGLENWHVLSKAGLRTLYVYMIKGKKYIIYSDFQVNDESNNYSFTYSNVQERYRQGTIDNTFPNCFGTSPSSSFSTKDNDNDGVDSENCADLNGGGWWYSGDCKTECNLLGALPRDWALYPVEQRLRLAGTDPDALLVSRNGIEAYLIE